MVASTREAVSKVMSEFQREGSIEIQNRKIVICSRLAKTCSHGRSSPFDRLQTCGVELEGRA